MHRNRLLIGVIAALTAVAAAACASPAGPAPPAAQPTSAAGVPQTYKVQVDARSDAANFGFLAYFPKELKVHPGDSIEFTSVFTGEPHTVTFGTLVDAGLPKAMADPNATDEPAELKKIPVLLPEGPGNAVQAVAQPCYLPSGDPPASAACPKAQQTEPAFDGTASLFNSGFLADGERFTVRIADTVKPGTYQYLCALHRAQMTGSVTVVDKAVPVPSPAEVTAEGKKQLADKVTKLAPTVAALRAGTLPPFQPAAKPGAVLAGGASMEVPDALVDEFGPKNTTIPVGSAVTWTVIGPHNIAFNAPENFRTLLAKAPDGTVNLNGAALAPAGGPGAPPPPTGPPPAGPPGPPTLVDAGAWNGAGLHNSGFMLSLPPSLLAYKMTFTKPGTYAYVCTVHPEMKGTVTVR